MPGTDIIKPDQYRALTVPEETFRNAVQQLTEQEVGEFDLTRIKIPAGGGTTWEIPSVRGTDSVQTIEGVVVFSKASRSYWNRAYAGGNEPPVCASNDGRTARQLASVDPETGAEITIPADRDPNGRLLCDTCRYAEFGSGDGRRQACKQMRQIFLLLPNRLLPAVVTLPPTSLKAARSYFLGLVDEGLVQHGVITRISLKKQKNEGTPEFSVAVFEVGEPLSAEQTARAEAYAQAARPRFMRVVATAEEAGMQPDPAAPDASDEPADAAPEPAAAAPEPPDAQTVDDPADE